jgi:hypothetical protein
VGVEAEQGRERDSCETSSAPFSGPLHPGTDAPSFIALLEMALDPEAWEAFSRGSATRRAGRAGFARNVCVALGNWGLSEAVPVLTRALGDPEPAMRGHAAWAVGGAGANELLSSAASEEDTWVLEELQAAMWGASGRSRGEAGTFRRDGGRPEGDFRAQVTPSARAAGVLPR